MRARDLLSSKGSWSYEGHWRSLRRVIRLFYRIKRRNHHAISVASMEYRRIEDTRIEEIECENVSRWEMQGCLGCDGGMAQVEERDIGLAKVVHGVAAPLAPQSGGCGTDSKDMGRRREIAKDWKGK